MKLIVDKRLALQERSGTVLVRGTEILTYGAQTKRLLPYTGREGRALTPAAPLPSIHAEDACLAWDGKNVLVADRYKRTVARVDPANGRETLVMDPTALAFGKHDTALLTGDAILGDIAWQDGLLYLAVQAGYSSTIYGIDVRKKRVVSHQPAPGPKPWGLDFDPADGSMYTVDGRNRELRRFAKSGTVEVTELPAEWKEPRGLSFDPERGLWSADWSTGDVLRMRVEG